MTMSNSQEENISLVEFKSPTRLHKKTKSRKNRVRSPPAPASSPPKNQGDNIVNLFSVKKAKNPSEGITENSESLTTTELSDDVFVESEDQKRKSENKSYRDKIRERFNVVKSRAGSSSHKASSYKGSREKLLLERVRKESTNIDDEVKSARSRFKLKKRSASQIQFFSGIKSPDKKTEKAEETDDPVQDSRLLLHYQSATQNEKEIATFETEHLCIPRSDPVELHRKLEECEPRFLEDEGLFVNQEHRIPKSNLNLIERRLLSLEDKKWFNCEGELIIQENGLLHTSLRDKKLLDDPNIASYAPPTSKIECNKIVVVKDNTLEVHLESLKFQHHPLFSIEHVFERKLLRLYEEYKSNLENNKLPRILKKLEAIRHVKKNVENNNKHGNIAEQIKRYDREIKDLRNVSYKEGKLERDNTKSTLETWKCIKKIREVNGYSNTKIKLVIKKENVDASKEQASQNKQLNETVEEILDEHKKEFKEKIKIYKNELQKWKDHQKSDDEEDPPGKPIYNIDEEKLRGDIKRQFEMSFRPPGEPILKFFLLNDNEVAKEVLNAKENIRRNAVNSTKISLKITCNKVEVCKTTPVYLNDDFNCIFREDLSIRLTNIPRCITVEVIEQPKALLRRKMCEIELNLPERNSECSSKFSDGFFEKQEIIHYKHEGVGSGVKLSTIVSPYGLSVGNNGDTYTSGNLIYNLRWDTIIRKDDEEEDSIGKLINDVIDKNGTINVEKLSGWLTSTTPDPQDPKNAILYEYISGFDKDLSFQDKTEYFRLSPHLQSLQFCDVKELEDNLRLTILQLRNQNEIEFDGMLIPNRVKEISFNALADYKKRIATEDRTNFEDDFDEDLDMQRSNNKKYLRQIHNRIFQKCKNSDNNLLYENVVNEKYLPYLEQIIKVLISNFFNWFRWRPRIPKPLPIAQKNDGKDAPVNTLNIVEQVSIIFKINNGININKKRNQMDVNSDNDKKEDNQNYAQSYLEISYNEESIRSSMSTGENPVWNEILSLPLESQNTDYLNPNSLSGTILINVYNYIEEIGEGHENWLGYIEIPLAAVCCSNILQGKFEIKEPLMLSELGELKKEKSPRSKNLPVATNRYVDVEISIEPHIPKLTPSMADLPSNEAPFIQEHIISWNEMYNNNFPGRKFSALAIDLHCRTNCVTKYIRPLEPPQLNSDAFDFGPDQCARYVSMVPFTDGNQFYHNVWLTTEQMLNLAIGSVIDHAVALTCYLLALKMDAWLLLGFGVPHGSTAYVLGKFFQRDVELPVYYIYDVRSAQKYYVTDEKCPLQKVFCVINESNVWANVQRNDNVSFTRFDLTRRSDWLVLFNKDFPAPTNSINFKVDYRAKLNIEYLEAHLEQKIKKRITKLRRLNRTVWRHNTSQTLKSFLRGMEINTMFQKSNYDIISEVHPIISSQKINGFVLNMLYCNMSTLIKRIEKTRIHIQKEENIEFGLAVYIHSYPGQILSVWLCLACFENI